MLQPAEGSEMVLAITNVCSQVNNYKAREERANARIAEMEASLMRAAEREADLEAEQAKLAADIIVRHARVHALQSQLQAAAAEAARLKEWLKELSTFFHGKMCDDDAHVEACDRIRAEVLTTKPTEATARVERLVGVLELMDAKYRPGVDVYEFAVFCHETASNALAEWRTP